MVELKMGDIVTIVRGGGLVIGNPEVPNELVGIVVMLKLWDKAYPVLGVNWVAGGPNYRSAHPDYDCTIKLETVKEVLGEIENDT
jgi:hypothetical protein